jgi:hypothetical protein
MPAELSKPFSIAPALYNPVRGFMAADTGAQIVGATLVRVLIDHWLSSEFAGGRSVPKVNRIKEIDDHYRRDRTLS